MNPVQYLENRWSHWFGGAEKFLSHSNLFAPLGDELASLTAQEATTLVNTAGVALAANLVKTAQGGNTNVMDALHQTGKDLEAQLPSIGLTISTEAIQGVVAAVSAANKQAQSAETAKPPVALEAPAAAEPVAEEAPAAPAETAAGG